MPLTTISFIVEPASSTPVPFIFAVPIAPMSDWVRAIAAPGLTTFDSESSGAPVLKPYNVTDGTRSIIERIEALTGTTLRLRLKYSENEAELPEIPLRVRVFGRYSDTSLWSPMRNLEDDCSVEVKMDLADDVIGGDGYRYTTPRNHTHAWDCHGYRQFLVTVEVVLDTDHAEDAELEVKID